MTLILLCFISSCATVEPIDKLEFNNVEVKVEKPSMPLPDPLILKKTIDPKAFIYDGEVMYCSDQVGLKNQIYNTKEYKRYLQEMLIYLESTEKD